MTDEETVKLYQAVQACLIRDHLWGDFLLDLITVARETPDIARACGRSDVVLHILEHTIRQPEKE